MIQNIAPYPEYQDQLSYIANDEVKLAYEYLVSASLSLKKFDVRPNPHGYITKNVHYFDSTGRSLFAFTVAKSWLLLYLRKPNVSHPKLTLQELKKVFPGAEQSSREYKFRISSPADAQHVMKLIFGVESVESISSAPGEIEESSEYIEGAVTRIIVNSYERNPQARLACISHYGCACSVCDFNFESVYGELGRDYIQVHHLVEVSSVREAYIVDPIRDLRPVCPNCHAMLHRRKPAFSIEELRDAYISAGKK